MMVVVLLLLLVPVMMVVGEEDLISFDSLQIFYGGFCFVKLKHVDPPAKKKVKLSYRLRYLYV